MSHHFFVTWPIESGGAIGPLRVGMPIDAAVRALEEAGLPVEQTKKGSATLYVSRGSTVHLVPEGNPETVGEIELVRLRSAARQPQAELSGYELLGQPLSDVQKSLSQPGRRR